MWQIISKGFNTVWPTPVQFVDDLKAQTAEITDVTRLPADLLQSFLEDLKLIYIQQLAPTNSLRRAYELILATSRQALVNHAATCRYLRSVIPSQTPFKRMTTEPLNRARPAPTTLTDPFNKQDTAFKELGLNVWGSLNESVLFTHSLLFLPPKEDRSFVIDEEVRFFGQWIVGEPGAGKTTFISTMIAEDLKKVARNEASIFVIDSQNELIPDIVRLEMFAPGRPLHDKLIYLEPNPDFPLALNIFDIDKKRASSLSSSEERMMYEAGAEWMVDFFLKSLVKSDETSSQETFLAYIIPAVLAIPNATIMTLQDLLEPARTKGGETGYDRYKQYFGGLRPTTQKWLRDRLHSDQLKVTRDAIRSRLDGFVARGFFGDMFAHPQNKLDLFKELQSSKVILINTKGALLKKNLEPFGRYFIARLLQAAEERMFTDRGSRMPVYAYIDEASDYISNEENIEELKNKARKQKVALIIANQMESQIEMPLVREALGKMAIQCRGEPPMRRGDAPIWHIQLGKQEPVQVSFPDTQFSQMPRMSERQFQDMLASMQDRYCSPAHDYSEQFEQEEAPRYQEPPKQDGSGQPKDDEYDDRYDQLDKITLSPTKAHTGTVLTVTCPNGRSHQQSIPAGVHNGYRFCVKGASKIRRPDNRNGNYWVELEIAEMPGARKAERPPDEESPNVKPDAPSW